MQQEPIRWAPVAEALALAALIALYIWKVQAGHPGYGIFLGIWFVVSIVAHDDSPKTLGWRGDNLAAATRQGAPWFVLFVAATSIAGAFFGAYHRMPVHFTALNRFLAYLGFCLLQQVALNSYLMNRLMGAHLPRVAACLLAGALFGALHWPNPVLVPLTFVGGVVMAGLFASHRNILPLALGQAILGALVWWALPMAWHHGMRVGPGFYAFHR
jgi:hypothetical protein